MRRLISRRKTRWALLGLLVTLAALALCAAWMRGTKPPSASAEGLPQVQFAAPRASAVVSRTVQTEALSKIGAIEYHARGYTGRGVKVAVIDDHFDGFADRIRDGELPGEPGNPGIPDLITRRFFADGSSTSALADDDASLAEEDEAHGVACAEIIHDIAPGATLYLIQVENLRSSLDEVFDYLHAEGVQIVSLSMSVSAESRGDGRGVLSESNVPIYDILDDVREKGMLVIKSAGNDATRHYSGAFRDTDRDGWHEFDQSWLRGVDEDLDLSVGEDAEIEITLSWDDWGDDPNRPASSQDYDLFLYDTRGRVAAQSTRVQVGGQPPVESISFTPPESGTYRIRISRADLSQGAPALAHQLSLRVRGEDVVLTEHQVPRGSLSVPADSPSVIAVAAADVATGRLVPYSSQGPTVDGRVKPDATSYTNVSVATPTYDPQKFPGTSAAAPHVAGMAALLWSMPENRHRDVEALTERLLSFAADRGAPGKDNQWGVGILQLPPLAPRVQIHKGGLACGDLVESASVERRRTVDPCSQADPALRAHPDDARIVYVPVSVHRADGSAILGLPGDAFHVDIGGISSKLRSVRELDDLYLLEIRLAPPRPASTDLPKERCDLTVTALGVEATVTRCLALPEGVEARGTSAAPALDVIFAPAAPRPGDVVAVLGSFSPAASLERGWVRGELRRPDGETDPFTLRDDGLHGDGVAGDGVYGGVYARATMPGTYRGVVTATASLRGTGMTVERRARITFHVQDDVPDDDQDGLPDAWEEAMRLNPAVKDALKDSDGDGLSNLEEYRHGAHPLHWDTDGDGLYDGAEVHGHFATSPASADTDLGGVDDGTELHRVTNPLDPADDGGQRQVYLPFTYRAYIPDFDPVHHAVTADAVWLATPHGLVRWDRTDGSYVKFTTHDGLVHNVVQAVAVDAGGRVWIGTQGGVSVLDGSRWRNYTSADGLAHDRVRDIAADLSGRVWFATVRGVSRFDGGRWTTYTTADGLIDDDVYAVASPAGDDRPWVGTRRGMSVFDGHAWRNYTTADGLPHPWVTDIAVDAQGQPWFATWGGGLGHLTQNVAAKPITPTVIGGQAGDYVSAIVEDTDERLWVHTTHGISTRDGATWATYVSDDHLMRQTQFDVPIDEAVHRWFGTRPIEDLPPHIRAVATARERPWYGIHGVTQTALGSWITYAGDGASTSVPVYAIAEGADGQIWIGTAGRLLAFDGSAWRDETAQAGLVDHRVSDIVVDDADRLWLGIDGQGVVQFDGDRWRFVEAGGGQTSLHVDALAVDGAERVWVGSKGGYVGLSVFDVGGDAWANLRLVDEVARQPMQDLAVDPQGHLWAATRSGILSFDGGVWAHHTPTEATWTLAVGPRGRVWAGAVGRISSYDGARWRTYPLPAGLEGSRVTALTVDSQGRVWAGTSDGAGVFDGAEWRIYTTADGLASDQIWAITVDRQGWIWFGTDAGITVHMPQEVGG